MLKEMPSLIVYKLHKHIYKIVYVILCESWSQCLHKVTSKTWEFHNSTTWLTLKTSFTQQWINLQFA